MPAREAAMPDYSVLIGGQAGDGIRQAGGLIAGLLSSRGYRIYFWDDYPSLIRGGHNFSLIRGCDRKIGAYKHGIDILVGLNRAAVDKHKSRLRPGGVVMYDSDAFEAEGLGVGLSGMVKKAGGKPVMRNIAALGAVGRLMGVGWDTVEAVIKQAMTKQTDLNLKIARMSYDAAGGPELEVAKLNQASLPLFQGNEAIALGAVRAGLSLYVAYPMTPSSSILHYLAQHEEELGIVTYHPENEIAAVITAIGGAYAGARTMVGTSGGGFALMTEGVSLCGQGETPVVFVVSQRAGPSTGVPTYTMQGDLGFVLNAGQGEFLRFVVAPGDPDEAFRLAGLAMNMAWKYQIPAFVLADKNLSESTYSFESKGDEVRREDAPTWDGKGDYKRYLDTRTGISPLSFPGVPGAAVKATSYEHDEYGLTTEEPAAIVRMQDKRLRKRRGLAEDAAVAGPVKVHGDTRSRTALVTWGSTKGACDEVAEDMGLRVVRPLILEPFPIDAFRKALDGTDRIIGVEVNSTGGLVRLLGCYGIRVTDTILKYDGRPFDTDGLRERVEEVVA
jgi:2-oxoglutarate ferredoxin oxidoreductase subunit alpha